MAVEVTNMEQESTMLTTEEVASRLRVTPKTLRSWVARTGHAPGAGRLTGAVLEVPAF